MPILVVGEGSDFNSAFSEALAVAGGMFSTAFEAAPALVFGLAVIVALPVLIGGGVILRRIAARSGADRTRSADKTARFQGSLSSESGAATAAGGRAAPAYSQAVIEVESDDEGETTGNREAFRFGTAMIARIGREEDNEIRLKHPTVHRYHALIRRSFEEGYEISDLSDSGGNGVIVNGERILTAPLADGDEIALGAARLRFGLTQ